MRLNRIKAGLTDSVGRVIALLIILIAFYITAGRQLVPLVSKFTPELEGVLASQISADVQVGALNGEWHGFNPSFIVENVKIGQILQVGNITITPAILSSFIQGRFVASSIVFSDIKIDISQNADDSNKPFNFSGFSVNSTSQGLNDSAGFEVKKIFDLLQPLLVQDKLVVQNLSVNMSFNDTENLGLHIEYADLNSIHDFKKLTLNGWLLSDGKPSNFSMIAELNDWQENHDGSIYLSQSEFDWSPWTKHLPLPVELSKFTSELELWLTLQQGKLTQIRSRVDVPEFELSRENRRLSLQNVHTEFSMDIDGNNYNAWLNDLEFKFQGKQWENSVHQVYWGEQGLEVLSNRLDIGLISKLGVVLSDIPALKATAPGGLLLNSRLVWEKQKDRENQVIVQGRFEDMQISPWQGIPGLNGINGYLDMTSSSGFVQIKPSDAWLTMPTVFSDPIYLENTRGNLIWNWSPELGVTLVGKNIQADVEGIENLEMGFSVLASPKKDWEIREPRLEFQLSFDKANEQKLAAFLPLTMDRQSRRWILDSVGYANFLNACLTLSIPTIPKPEIAMSMLLDMDITDSSMSFLPEWPEVTQIDASIKLDGSSLAVTVPKARFNDFELLTGEIKLPLKAGAVVSLDFDATGSANSALNIMKSTPLRSFVDSNLDSWVAPQGDIDGHFQLNIPLDNRPIRGNVHLDIQETELVLSEYELAVNSLNGRINWSDKTGISSERLKAEFFGYPTVFDIKTSGKELDIIEVATRGRLDVDDLGLWLDDGMLQSMPQSTNYQANMKIMSEQVDLDIHTNLEGINLSYTYPFDKATDQSWPLNVKLTFDNYDQTWINATLNNRFSAAFLLKDSIIEKGNIRTGLNAELPEEAGVYFKLDLDRLDGDKWQEHIEDFIELYDGYMPAVVTGAPGFDEQIREFVVTASEMIYFDEPWNRAEVLGARTEEGWIANFKANEVQGTFGWGHEEDAIMVVDIDFVKVYTDEVPETPEGEAEPEFIDLLADYDPTEIPAAIIQVKRFVLDERDLGGWTTQLKPIQDGVRIANVEGHITGVDVLGEIDWVKRNGKQFTSLTSKATMRNLGDVLAQWELTRDIMTENGQLNVDLDWPGSPLGFELPKIEGIVDLDFRNGAILNVDQEYESLKLLSIFNFSLIMRRLAFDFRDIVQEGIGFDSVTGKLQFKDGILVLASPIAVDGSSTKVRLGGQYDLNADLLDFEMVFTLPISSALPFAALIAGLSPQVAVAVFVTERLMNNELEKITSAKYEIKGSSKKPSYRLIKAFDNSLKAPATQ